MQAKEYYIGDIKLRNFVSTMAFRTSSYSLRFWLPLVVNSLQVTLGWSRCWKVLQSLQMPNSGQFRVLKLRWFWHLWWARQFTIIFHVLYCNVGYLLNMCTSLRKGQTVLTHIDSYKQAGKIDTILLLRENQCPFPIKRGELLQLHPQ